ncbi:MAG: tetratricopeptide repeat protein, partial [Acidobacteriaceae bacterium]
MSRPIAAAAASVLAATLLLAGCHSRSGLPKPSSPEYAKLVSTFYVGLSALQVGDDVRAQSSLQQATQIAPGEPASWANWGILALRQRNFDPAAERFDRARELDPNNAQMYYLLGLLGSAQGNSQQAITNYQKAVKLDPRNLRALYALALETERQQAPGYEQQFQKLIQQILAAQPNNLAALLELSRISAKQGDAATLRSAVQSIAAQSADWPADIKQQLADLRKAASGPDVHSAATRSIFLRNVLMQLPSFRNDLAQIKPAPGDEAQPFTHFLRLPSPSSTPAQPDTQLTFTQQPIPNLNQHWAWIGAVSLTGEGP